MGQKDMHPDNLIGTIGLSSFSQGWHALTVRYLGSIGAYERLFWNEAQRQILRAMHAWRDEEVTPLAVTEAASRLSADVIAELTLEIVTWVNLNIIPWFSVIGALQTYRSHCLVDLLIALERWQHLGSREASTALVERASGTCHACRQRLLTVVALGYGTLGITQRDVRQYISMSDEAWTEWLALPAK